MKITLIFQAILFFSRTLQIQVKRTLVTHTHWRKSVNLSACEVAKNKKKKRFFFSKSRLSWCKDIAKRTAYCSRSIRSSILNVIGRRKTSRAPAEVCIGNTIYTDARRAAYPPKARRSPIPMPAAFVLTLSSSEMVRRKAMGWDTRGKVPL